MPSSATSPAGSCSASVPGSERPSGSTTSRTKPWHATWTCCRLIDALVGYGSPERIRRSIDAHLAAGASHVAVQVLDEDIAGTIAALDLGRAASGDARQ